MRLSGCIYVAALIVMPGCVPSTPPVRDAPEKSPPPDPVAQPTAEFETRTDTLRVGREIRSAQTDTSDLQALSGFLIQIGAFKDPQNASLVQSLARERYHLPVLYEFTQPPGLYLIRVGYFASYGSAHEFLVQMQHDFPQEYADSWIVQQKR